MKRLLSTCVIAALTAGASAAPAAAQATKPILGQLIMVGFGFCPSGWTEAAGQTLIISQNTALFSLLGTTFGGNGQNTFSLPDLRARVPLGQGQGFRLPAVVLGEWKGAASTALAEDQLPLHRHNLRASGSPPTSLDPTARSLASFPSPQQKIYAKGGPLDLAMDKDAIGKTGAGVPFPQYQPTLSVRYCIALQGQFPSF